MTGGWVDPLQGEGLCVRAAMVKVDGSGKKFFKNHT
jgi:hypothetical protein